MNPAFAPKNIKALYPLFWDKTREMVERITADKLETVEVVEWASRITLDLIGVAGLGRDFCAIQNAKNEMVKTYDVVPSPYAAPHREFGSSLGPHSFTYQTQLGYEPGSPIDTRDVQRHNIFEAEETQGEEIG
ncbi:hypothetical protein LB505_001174 [Fusarium chuoi]|nr:hypothetical protein LB505_001174 [Fusarium chuoi]